MDVSFGPLVPGRFLERLSRFHARVEVEGDVVLAHVPNSGRLRELFVPGAELRLRPAARPDRKTAFDVVLVRVPSRERGPGARGRVWACIDARLPPKIVAAAAGRGAIGALRGCELVRTEPALGAGRADLLFTDPDGADVLVETKSITLVRAGAGLFPDSPTARGTAHVRELAGLRRVRRVVALVVQRPDARAVRANEPADRDFAKALYRARERGVEVAGVVCRVTAKGIAVREEVPLERYSPETDVETLPDHLRGGLRLLICGLNPGHYAAWYGGYYARPGNRFWPTARRAGLVPPTVNPGDEGYLARAHGIGFTDLVKRPSASIDELTPDEWRAGAERLRRIVRRYRPARLCFVGLRAAREVLGPQVGPGPVPEPVGGTPAFAVPNPSGRQAAYPPRELTRWFRELVAWVEG